MTSLEHRIDREAERAIIMRLRRFRDRGQPVPALLVRQAAEWIGIRERQVWRRINVTPEQLEDQQRGRTRRGYQLTDDDKEAYVRLGGDVSAVYGERAARGLVVPSRPTLWRAFRDPAQFTAADRAYAVEGRVGARKYQIAVSWEPENRNELWEADHKELPVEVQHNGRCLRPWVTLFEDGKTRALMGYSINETQTAADVHAALRKGIEHHPDRGPFSGMPDVVVWDGGKEFLAHSVSGMCARMGILARPNPPRSPWLKGKIERFNRTLEHSFLKTLPGYQNGARKDDGSLYGTKDRLTLGHLVELFEEFVLTYNLDRAHRALDGHTPKQAWEADHAPLDVPEPERLRWLAQSTARRKVTKHGVEIMRNLYKSATIDKLVGEWVDLRHMPHDARSIDVYHKSAFVVTLQPDDQMTPEEQDEMLAQRRRSNKERERVRRRVARTQRIRFAPITAPGTVAQVTVISRDRAREEGQTRVDRDLHRRANLGVIRDELDELGDTLPDLDAPEGAEETSADGTPDEDPLLGELGVSGEILSSLDEETSD